MFDTIILLTGPAEHSVFTTLLRGHNPKLTVLPVFTADDLAAIEPEWLSRARLISFTTNVVVSGTVLDRLGFGAYHFHPGSPRYPGRAPARAALDDGATEFGGTVHRMTADISAGPIVDVERFAIAEGATVGGLEEQAYTTLVAMFWRLAGALATQDAPLLARAVRWGSAKVDAQPRRPAVEAGHVVRLAPNNDLRLLPRIGGPRLWAVIAETEPA